MDKRGIVIRNKARLVAQGNTQEEGIDYDEVFAPVATIEAIRLFLAYASLKDFIAYQMDAKSAFLYGKIEEEVYVCQPLGFKDPNFPDKVYKVKKALYGLHQAPRAYGKRVVINEASIRHDLKLNDTEGTSCLSNAVIFEELARIGAKTTSWNEFRSTMASAIICLANNQKFNFSKYILDNLKKNLEAGVPFYMFPRFIQVFGNHQLRNMSHHKVQALDEVGDLPTDVQDTPIPDAPSSSQPQRKHNPRRKGGMKLSGEDRMQLKELMDLCTNLSNKVLDLENEVIEMKSSHKAKIKELESKEKIADIEADAEVNLKNVYNLDIAHKETVLSMQDVDVQSERIEDVVKEVAKDMGEVMEIAKIIVDEVSTASGELNAANEKLVSVAPTNITTARPSEATKTTVDITTAPKAKGIVFQDKEESTTKTASLKTQAKDKGKAKLVEEPKILKSRKAQIALDEEVARRIETE
nr:copia protein [Tanacetum cinerariifolium]